MSILTDNEDDFGPTPFNRRLANVLGGYPRGAIVQASNNVGWWLCLQDDNSSDPDAGGAGWCAIPDPDDVAARQYTSAVLALASRPPVHPQHEVSGYLTELQHGPAEDSCDGAAGDDSPKMPRRRDFAPAYGLAMLVASALIVIGSVAYFMFRTIPS